MTPGQAQPIAVFDSGVGGLSILRAVRRELPAEDVVYFADAGHAPYGERGDTFVAQRLLAVADDLLQRHAPKAFVVACNTATVAAIQRLREAHPTLPVIGVEPALKPAAALTRTGRCALFATRGTVGSARVAALCESLRAQAEFVLVPCDGLAAAIEADDTAQVRMLCERSTRAAGRFGGAPGEIDVLVLGCTHYPFAAGVLRELLGPAVTLVDTGAPVARQLRRVLQAANLLRSGGEGTVRWETSGAPAALQAAVARWLTASGPR